MKTVHITIDSRDARATNICFDDGKKHDNRQTSGTNAHSQVIVPMIEELLLAHQKTVDDIAKVTVLVDHGSFTGRRVGAVIAKMLGSLLQIPVNGQAADMPIDIPYEADKWR